MLCPFIAQPATPTPTPMTATTKYLRTDHLTIASARNTISNSAVPASEWSNEMIGPLLAIFFAVEAAPTSDPVTTLCRDALARKAGGEIATFDVKSSTTKHREHVLSGQLTANVGMGAPQPGHASAHHLIRSDFTFRCRISKGRVREVRLNPLTGA